MKTNKTQKKKNSDFYEDFSARPGSKYTGKKEKPTKKKLSIYDDFDDDEDFVTKASKRF